MSGKKVSYYHIKEVRDRAFSINAKNLDGYGYRTNRGIYEYEQFLPTFRGKKLMELIGEKFEQTQEPIAVLDIGCGSADMLGELINPEFEYPPMRAYGLSAFDYRLRLTQQQKMFIDPDGEIDYRVGDAHKLRSVFPDVKFDLVVSFQTFMHLADPLAVLKQAYSVCKEGGIMLVDFFGQPLTPSQVDLLRAFWKKDGIEAEFHRFPNARKLKGHSAEYSVAIQKNKNPKLRMPFLYKGERVFTTLANTPPFIRLGYEFDRKEVEIIVRRK